MDIKRLILTLFVTLSTANTHAAVLLRETDKIQGCEARDLQDALKDHPNRSFFWESATREVSPLLFQNAIQITCLPATHSCLLVFDLMVAGSPDLTESFDSPEWEQTLSISPGNSQLTIKKLPTSVAPAVLQTLKKKGFKEDGQWKYRWINYGDGFSNHQGLPLNIRITNQLRCTDQDNCWVESQSLFFIPYNELQECEIPEQDIALTS